MEEIYFMPLMGEYVIGEFEKLPLSIVCLAKDTEAVRFVPVVLCKDCRFYEKGDSGWWCKRSITLVPDPDGFCAWGERKVVEQND